MQPLTKIVLSLTFLIFFTVASIYHLTEGRDFDFMTVLLIMVLLTGLLITGFIEWI